MPLAAKANGQKSVGKAQSGQMTQDERRVLAFYHFTPIDDPEQHRCDLQQLGERLDLRGTILLAAEGVNGTVVGSVEALKQLQAVLTQVYAATSIKWSDLEPGNPGFHRFKVRVKPEIVSFGVDQLDMRQTGEHVGVQRWNELLDDPDVVVIDTRNQYEIDIGTFDNALTPQTASFREFPEWVAANLDPEKQPKVAMFCTGGIRCEKASSFLLAQGVREVYQLNGGILQYLEDVEPDASRWHGECFVFDQRVSVTPELKQGHYRQCYACRHPLSAEEYASPEFEHGVSCPYCIDATSEERREQFRERQRQVKLAVDQGREHIGYNHRKRRTAEKNN